MKEIDFIDYSGYKPGKLKTEKKEVDDEEEIQAIPEIVQSRFEITENVVEMMRQRRKAKGISQVLLSKISNVDQAHISRIERLERRDVTFSILAKLFFALEIKFAEIDDIVDTIY